MNYANKFGDTALLAACTAKLERVACQIIETGKCNPKQCNNWGYDAYMMADKNKLQEVSMKLREVFG